MNPSETIFKRSAQGKIIHVDPSDDLKIYKSMDYNQFILMPENRQIYTKHVKNLSKSILDNGYLKERPIEVIKSNSKLMIVDGQHRFTACSELKLPVYYVIKPESETQAASAVRVVNNNARTWKAEDYMKHFLATGHIAYVRLSQFMEDFDLGISAALGLLALNGDNLSNNDRTKENFKNGHLHFDEESIVAAALTMKPVNEIRNFHERISLFRRDAAFVKALIIMTKSKIYDHDRMMKNLSSNISMCVYCTSISRYLDVLEGIYNFKRKDGTRVHLSRKGMTLIKHENAELQ